MIKARTVKNVLKMLHENKIISDGELNRITNDYKYNVLKPEQLRRFEKK